MNITLWIIQSLLAALFLFAGGSKFVLPDEVLTSGPVVLPVLFIRFIGVCEVLGAFGLILPSLLRIRPSLTPLAASGLIIIMIGAVTTTLMGGREWISTAILPFVVGVLLVFVAYGRSRLAPIVERRPRSPAASSAARV
jgi:hypothetical protein